MNGQNTIYFGWKYYKQHGQAMTKKRSKWDFFLSIIIAFFVIILISQLLVRLDSLVGPNFVQKNLSIINPIGASEALAAESDQSPFVGGNLVKISGSTAVYFVKDNFRYAFPFQKVYQAYYGNDFKKVKTITPSQLTSYTLKGNVKLPAKSLVKVATDPRVYEVSYVGDIAYLTWVPNEAQAKVQFGSNWTSKIIDMPDAFFVDYKVATVLQTQTVVDNSKPVGLVEICLSLKPSEQKTVAQKMLLDECQKIGANVTDEGVVFIDPTPIPITVTNPIESTPTTTPIPVTPTPQIPTAPMLSNPANLGTTIDNSNGPLIRVGLYYTTSSVIMTANTFYSIKDQNKAVLATVPANVQSKVTFDFSTKTYSLSANGVNIATSSYPRFEGASQTTVFEIVNFDNEPGWNADINDNRFLGNMEVRYASATNRLWVIDELQMEDYLKGLAETTNYSPMEYQKALVTAARSYAYYHYSRGTKHAAENFTVDASYDQVYRGYNSEQRLTEVADAVNQTKGMLVTYNGNPVVTPYFSWSDGHTRNWEDVWGGSVVPWCRAVKEPQGYDKTTMNGHGVGLSARGAILLANNFNYSYDQILKYYFTGVEIKKIY